MWGAVAAWLICLASLSLPWPGIILVVLLCCVAFFELASPLKGGGIGNTNDNGHAAATGAHAGAVPTSTASKGRSLSLRANPSAALAEAFQLLTERLRGRVGSGGRMEELGVSMVGGATADGDSGGGYGGVNGVGGQHPSSSSSTSPNTQAAATFLKGTVGSFSRGGLMVTHDQRVIYKVNQDRGLISHPSLNEARHTIFGVFDGHGENGEQVAAYAMREVPRRLALHADARHDPTSALEDVFVDINKSLPQSGINAVFGGCTAVVALVRGAKVWVANAGDSRALVAGRGKDGKIVARGLTRDQNPDSPGERERIEAMGGFVSDPEETGGSARVWLDATRTMVGLAMARSIGDLAVKRVGVISLPEVTEYVLTPEDKFLVLASDGVWEFIDNQEAAEIVQRFLDKGADAAGACKGLMEMANRRWSDMVGDYRDDITATVVRIPFLPPEAAAAAAAVNASTIDNIGAVERGTAPAESATAKGDDTGPSPDPSKRLPKAELPPTSPLRVQMAPFHERSEPEAPSDESDGDDFDDASVSLQGVKVEGAAVEFMMPDLTSSGYGNDDGDDGDSSDGGVTGGVKARPKRSGVRGRGVLPGRNSDIAKRGENMTVGPAGSMEDTSKIEQDVEHVDDVDDDVNAGAMREGVDDTLKGASLLSEALTEGNEANGELSGKGTATATPAAERKALSAPAYLPSQVTPGAEITGEEGLVKVIGIQDREDEAWELEFGARENRQPSKEMMEASLEFPPGSLGARVAGLESCET